MHGDPVFPSLGSAMGHSYVVSDGLAGSTGSTGAAPVTYIAFQHNAAAAPAPTLAVVQEEIRTVFVTGFPDNVQERELHNLCRFIPGYEASQVAIKPNQQPQVFVLFQTAAHARQALDALAGLPFDVQQPLLHTVSNKVLPLGAGEAASVGASTASLTQAVSVLAQPAAATPQPAQPLPATSSGAGAGADEPAAGAVGAGASAGAKQSPGGAPAAAAAPTGATSGGGSAGEEGGADGAAARLASFVSAAGNGVLAAAAAPGGPLLGTGSSGLEQLTVTLPGTGSGGLGGAGVHVHHSVQLLPPVKYSLRCEMAHKNLYIKEGDPSVRQPHRPIVLLPNPGASQPVPQAQALAVSGGATYLQELPGGVYSQAVGGGAGGVAHTLSMHPLVAGGGAGGTPQPTVLQHHAGVGALPLGTPLGFLPVTNRGDNPPCNTLFIGNLSDQVSELELLHLLSGQPGYRQMKLVRGPRQVSCFVEFEDTMSATAVHNNYQGAVLASSDRAGTRIQYSKNPFGKRSSTPGSNMMALRQAVSLQSAAAGLGLEHLGGTPTHLVHGGAGGAATLVATGSSGLSPMGAATVGMAGMGNWPVVTYHTMPQHAGQTVALQQAPGASSITYY